MIRRWPTWILHTQARAHRVPTPAELNTDSAEPDQHDTNELDQHNHDLERHNP